MFKGLPGVLVLMLFFSPLLTGCSKEASDKLLRTFIDGVPVHEEKNPAPDKKDEKAKSKNEIKNKTVLPPAPVQFFHLPFLKDECDSCHDSKFSQKLALKGKELCFGCHDDFTKNKKAVHYPVSEEGCIGCHDPHKSPNKFMLKEPAPKLCFTCHDEKAIRATPAHEGQNICTECHNPHASNEEKLLK